MTSWRGPSRVIAPAGNTGVLEEMSHRWRAVDRSVSDLTSPRYKPTVRPPDPETNASPLD